MNIIKSDSKIVHAIYIGTGTSKWTSFHFTWYWLSHTVRWCLALWGRQKLIRYTLIQTTHKCVPSKSQPLWWRWRQAQWQDSAAYSAQFRRLVNCISSKPTWHSVNYSTTCPVTSRSWTSVRRTSRCPVSELSLTNNASEYIRFGLVTLTHVHAVGLGIVTVNEG